MADNAQVFVDTRYPLPANVDGVIYYVAETADSAIPWQMAEPEEKSNSINPPINLTPVPLEVIEQKVTYALGGSAVATGVLLIDEIPYVSDYEIRIVPR